MRVLGRLKPRGQLEATGWALLCVGLLLEVSRVAGWTTWSKLIPAVVLWAGVLLWLVAAARRWRAGSLAGRVEAVHASNAPLIFRAMRRIAYLSGWDHSKPLARTKATSRAIVAVIYAVVAVICFAVGAWVLGVAWIAFALVALVSSLYYRRRQLR